MIINHLPRSERVLTPLEIRNPCKDAKRFECCSDARRGKNCARQWSIPKKQTQHSILKEASQNLDFFLPKMGSAFDSGRPGWQHHPPRGCPGTSKGAERNMSKKSWRRNPWTGQTSQARCAFFKVDMENESISRFPQKNSNTSQLISTAKALRSL